MTQGTNIGAQSAPDKTRRRERFRLSRGLSHAGRPNVKKRIGNTRIYWLFIIPALLFYAFITLIPLGQGVLYSFTNWNGLSPDWDFVGLSNFKVMFTDPIARKAAGNTVIYAATTTVFENLFGLAIALGIANKLKSRRVLQTLFFLPVVLLSIVVAYLWQYLFLPNNGVFVGLVESLGFDTSSLNMMGDPDTVVYAIAIMVVWQYTGFTMLIYIAGIQSVPGELTEAAALDGAGRWQRFVHVTLPALAPALMVNLILSMVRGFMIFDQIWATTLGGPADSSHSLSTLIYRTAFQFGKMGQGSALAVTLGVFVVVVGAFQYRAQLRFGGK